MYNNNDDIIIIRMYKDHNLIKHCEVSNNVSADMYTCRFTCEYMYTCVCVCIVYYRLEVGSG